MVVSHHFSGLRAASSRCGPRLLAVCWGQLLARLPVAACLLLLCLGMPPTYGDGWDTVAEEDGVLVLQRPYGSSPLMELRGEVRLQASLNAVMALLRDADYNRSWVYRSGGATILQASGYSPVYVHGVVDAPWPIQDRDSVVRFDYAQDAGTLAITIDIANTNAFLPPRPGLVRVPDIGGFWQLIPLPGGYVDVIYQVHGDPGGWVPPWLANYAATLSVLNTLRNMPGAVVRYRGATSGHVAELNSTASELIPAD